MNFKKMSTNMLYLVIFLIPFYFFRFSFSILKTNIFEIILALSSLFYIVSLFQNNKDMPEIKQGFKGWFLPLIFLLASLIAVLLASDKEKAIGIFKGWFLAPIVFSWLVARNFNKKNIIKLSVPIFISILITSIWAILQKCGVISTLFYQVGDTSFNQYLAEGRVFGPFESPNYLAMFLVSVTFLALPVVELIKDFKYKLPILISFLLPVIALYLSSSRAGFAAFIICVALLINYRFINLQKSKERRPFYVGLFVLAFVFVNIGYLFFATNNFKPESGGDKIRVEIYKYSISLIEKHPILGIGLGSFQDKLSTISLDNLSFQKYALPYALHPHNLFMTLWLNLGLLGLLAFITILVTVFKRLFASDSHLRGYYIAALAALLVHGLFDTTYFINDLSAIFWLIYAGAIVLEENNEKHSS